MRLLRRVVLVMVVVLGWALVPSGPAWAKGPVGVEIEGPGLQDPLVVEMNSPAAEEMWALEEQVGLFANTRTLSVRPAGDLGAAYRLTWFFSEAQERDRVQQDVYPLAASGPVVHTLPGDTDWHRLVPAGWTNAGSGLADAFTRLGVPLAGPEQAEAEIPAIARVDQALGEPDSDPPWLAVSIAVAALIAVVGAAAGFARRRATLRV